MTDNRTDTTSRPSTHPTRREIVASGVLVPIAAGLPSAVAAQPSTNATTPEAVSVSLTVNGTRYALMLDERLLQRMQRAGCETLDSGDLRAIVHDGKR